MGLHASSNNDRMIPSEFFGWELLDFPEDLNHVELAFLAMVGKNHIYIYI